MNQTKIPATFIRGGTSKGLFFCAADLPAGKIARHEIFLNALGSPDQYGRQLNGMGGGLSSLSKAVIIKPSKRKNVDVDFTFAQIAIKQPVIDLSATCGNLSSAVGPFAIDNGMVSATGKSTKVRVYNTNTNSCFVAHVPTKLGLFQPKGSFSIPGVSGTGSKITLNYSDPCGTSTGKMLPSSEVIQKMKVPELGEIEVSLLDASTPCLFVKADCFSLTNHERIEELEGNLKLMASLERIRRLASVQMNLSKTPESASLGTPKICLVTKPSRFKTLSSNWVEENEFDISARCLSMGQVHRALPLTAAMCLAVACKLRGSVCHRLINGRKSEILIGTPSGIIPVKVKMVTENEGPIAKEVTVYRTARALMSGSVLLPLSPN